MLAWDDDQAAELWAAHHHRILHDHRILVDDLRNTGSATARALASELVRNRAGLAWLGGEGADALVGSLRSIEAVIHVVSSHQANAAALFGG